MVGRILVETVPKGDYFVNSEIDGAIPRTTAAGFPWNPPTGGLLSISTRAGHSQQEDGEHASHSYTHRSASSGGSGKQETQRLDAVVRALGETCVQPLANL